MTTELLTDSSHSREDLRMIETAIRKDWQIPDQLLEALPKVAGAMALKGKPRDQIAAMKVLLAMKEQNDGKSSGTVNVGVSLAGVPDTGRGFASAVLARLRNDGVSEAVSGEHER